jgi:hypothetical protein
MHAKDYILWSVQPSIICIFVHMPSSLGKLYDLRIIIYYSTHPLNYSPTHIFVDLFSGLQVQCNKISIAFLFIAIPFLVACSWIHTWKDVLEGSCGARNRLSKQNKNYSLASFVIVWELVAKTGLNLVYISWISHRKRHNRNALVKDIQPILWARFENQTKRSYNLLPRLHPSFPNFSLNLAEKSLAASMVCLKI